MSVIALIKREEGYRIEPYFCSEGYPTIGYGFKIGPKGADLAQYQFQCPEPVADTWLQVELRKIESQIEQTILSETYKSMSEPRRAIVLSMCYQMGVAGFLGFKKAIQAMIDEQWEKAGMEMLDSRWARQTPSRAQRHAEQMIIGRWHGYYFES